jgi:hypothetical protein
MHFYVFNFRVTNVTNISMYQNKKRLNLYLKILLNFVKPKGVDCRGKFPDLIFVGQRRCYAYQSFS